MLDAAICILTEPTLKQICIFNFAAILGAENLNTKFTEKNRKINAFQKTDVSCVKIEAKQTQHCVIRECVAKKCERDPMGISSHISDFFV